jgi:hypothetical protein
MGGVNSGRNVMTINTPSLGTRSIMRSRDSRVVGSLQAEWQEFGQRLAAANAAYAGSLAQSQPVQVQPLPQVPQQTFCNQLGNTTTCTTGTRQVFCSRIGNTITCQ